MAGMTIPKYTTPDKIVDAINAAGAYSITAIAKELGMRHSALIYHFNQIPVLKNYYTSLNKLVIEQEKKEKRKKIEYVLRNARKNSPYAELYRLLGMTHREFFDCLHSRKSLEGLFNRLYDGSRKMKKETVENIAKRIDRLPKRTHVCDLWPGRNTADYLRNNRELKNKYVKKNGKIKIGRPKPRK